MDEITYTEKEVKALIDDLLSIGEPELYYLDIEKWWATNKKK